MYEDYRKELESIFAFTHGININDYYSGYIGDVFSEIADSNVDIYTSDLFEWGKNNLSYIDEATKEFGNPNDIIKQIQQGQYYAFEQELYEYKDDILKYFAYSYLNDNDIKLTEEQEEDLESYVCSLDSNDTLDSIIDYCKELSEGYDIA